MRDLAALTIHLLVRIARLLGVPTKISIPMPNRPSIIHNAYLTLSLRPLGGIRDADAKEGGG